MLLTITYQGDNASGLGYILHKNPDRPDEKYPEWGEGCYVNLSLSCRCLLKDLLSHLYVLIPVFDRGYSLDAKDVIGKRRVITSLSGGITVKEENAAAAFEIMSRFAADPRWLVYLPPTMSPCATSPLDDYLEQPSEAFGYFRSNDVKTVVCEEKHMGSRAVIVVCRDEKTSYSRFN